MPIRPRPCSKVGSPFPVFRQLFPSPDYMRQRYGLKPGDRLIPLYYRRIIKAFQGLLTRGNRKNKEAD